jgi:hypothetical protein
VKLKGQVLAVEGNLPGKKIAMTIAAHAVPFVMGALTKLYSDAKMAVLREYATNARDSHVEAGCLDRPIEISLPNDLSPFLKIRDYGVGLSETDIEEIYSQYGASTKRDSNDATGMLGFGCKSGLAYAPQFTLSGIKDGVRTEVVVSRGKDGGGDMTPVTSYPVDMTGDDEQGVEIVIPVEPGDRQAFAERAEKLFRFWPEGSVLVDGKAPARVDGLWLSDDLLLSREVADDGMIVVQGGVPYPVKYRYNASGYGNDRFGLVAFVNIGDVAFTPSRESLEMDDPDTAAKVDEILEREKTEKQKALLARVAEAPDAPTAVKVAAEARRMGLRETAMWNGHEVPAAHQLEGKKLTVGKVNRRYRDKGFGEVNAVPSGQNVFWLGGFPNPKFTPYKRQKLDQWWGKRAADLVPEGEEGPVDFIIAPEIPQEIRMWIPDGRVLPWAQVEAEKIAKPKADGSTGTTASGRPAGTYPGFRLTGGQTDIDPSAVPAHLLFYYQGSSAWDEPTPERVRALMAEVLPEDEDKEGAVIILSQNRAEKFLRTYPYATEVSDALEARAKKWQESLTDDDLLALSMNGDTPRIVSILDPERVPDPEFAEAIRAVKRHDSVNAKLERYGRWTDVTIPEPYDVNEKYPLLAEMDDRYYYRNASPHDHVYLYISAAHEAAAVAAPAAGEEKAQ